MSKGALHKAPKGFLESLRRLAYRNPLYAYTLVGRAPKRLFGTPPELMPGDAAGGQIILAGNLIYGGQRWPFADISHLPENASQHWLSYVHGFSWLSELRAVGSNTARQLARDHLSDWINCYTRWTPLAWRADIIGQRLTSWLTHFGFFAGDAPQEFYDLFFIEVVKQARHLNRTIMKSVTGPGRIPNRNRWRSDQFGRFSGRIRFDDFSHRFDDGRLDSQRLRRGFPAATNRGESNYQG